MKKNLKSFTAISLLAVSSLAHSNFYVDYQGVIEERKNARDAMEKQSKEAESHAAFLSNYKVLADKSLSVLEQIGDPKPEETSVFGVSTPLKDAMLLIMPDKWISYIHKDVPESIPVDFEGNNQHWTKVLADIGINYGYRFVVDWNQHQIQVQIDPNFEKAMHSQSTAYQDLETGRMIYVISDAPDEAGIQVDGKIIPVKFID